MKNGFIPVFEAINGENERGDGGTRSGYFLDRAVADQVARAGRQYSSVREHKGLVLDDQVYIISGSVTPVTLTAGTREAILSKLTEDERRILGI